MVRERNHWLNNTRDSAQAFVAECVHLFLAQIRLSTTMLFWEIFAGCAELTHQFEKFGWSCATPIDCFGGPVIRRLPP